MGKDRPVEPVSVPPPAKYQMRISRLTVDKLGVKLYDRVSAVIAELVANCYDADATEVVISAPMGELLAEKHQGVLKDKGYAIEVKDNGIGMTPDEVIRFYLILGSERRADPARGDRSRRLNRKVMGRKGVGKIAPLGICERIEIITSGGNEVKEGKAKGYRTAHIILHRAQMMIDTGEPYEPEVGAHDGGLLPEAGTVVRMMQFDHRHVPDIENFDRQLAQRFGVQSANWKIILRDSQKTANAAGGKRPVGTFPIELRPGTRIEFKEELTSSGKSYNPRKFSAFGPDGNIRTDLTAEFEHEGVQFPLTGWVGYSSHPYRDDLMAGVRIYCRGKIAAQTRIFNMKAGFTGEYDIRSYLVGELYADWLDEAEDLIRTDRQDILWSHPLGQAFETWGQKMVKAIGSITREPMRKQAWEIFKERTKIEDKVQKAFPADAQKDIRERTLEIAKTIARAARSDELQDDVHCRALLDLAMLLGPHISLERKLIEAAESKDRPLDVVTDILRTARVAELSSFGRIADDRVKVIKKVEELKDNANTLEEAFQKLIEEAPWLINPQWSPIISNQALTTLKAEFVKFYKEQTGKDIVLFGFDTAVQKKRPDFVLSNQDQVIQIIEIKKPKHALQNAELDRIIDYHDVMQDFLNKKGHEEFLKLFSGGFHITLVCDEIGLKGAQRTAFNGLKDGSSGDKCECRGKRPSPSKKAHKSRDARTKKRKSLKDSGRLTHVTWTVFLVRTRKMHEEFLKEAERQRRDAAKNF